MRTFRLLPKQGDRVKFDYGQSVLHKITSQQGIGTTRVGSVVGVTQVETTEQSEHFGRPLGTVLYTIEYSDGTYQSVAEGDLRAV
jgi:hypothetical protein